jgi:hypothetical protein
MKVYLTVEIKPANEDQERFAVDNCKPMQVDMHMTTEQLYSLLLGQLSPMADKTALSFSRAVKGGTE